MELRDINEFTHGTIRFGGVKLNGPFKANSFHHQFGEFPDSQFFACAHIDVTVADLTQ